MIGILLASTSTEGHGQSALSGNQATLADSFPFACHGNVILTAPFTQGGT
jgi:hypothetical protein